MSEPVFRKQDAPEPNVLSTHSIVSHRTGRGIVVLQWHGHEAQFDPEDARKFAQEILRIADNAESDAFLYSHFQDFLNNNQLAVLITEFRKHRAKLEQLAGLRPTGQPIPEDDAR